MSLPLDLTSELDVVNLMLSAIGEADVDALPSDLPEAQRAMRVLGVINRSVQARGWHWNTDLDVPLTPDGAGEIVLAGTTLKVDPMDQNRDFVQRGTKLYNPRTQTYTFTSAIKCKVVVLLDFELLPENARYYIAVKAARSFQTTDLGSATLHQFTEADEQLALINLLQAEGDTRGATMLNDYNLASRLRRS